MADDDHVDVHLLFTVASMSVMSIVRLFHSWINESRPAQVDCTYPMIAVGGDVGLK